MPRPHSPQLSFTTVLSHVGVIIAVSAVMGVLVAGLAIPFAGLLGVGSHALSRSLKNLPEEVQVTPLSQRSRVLDRDGQVIATFYDENRVNVTLAEVSPMMRKAIVAIEDDRFYEHGAIDLKGTLRAFITNQTNDGVTQGGSSITQQMAKLTLLNQAKTRAERKAATADTYQRKIKELRVAIGFEQKYSKDQILERYLNLAYFGDGAYGIQAAAKHYFSKNANQLNAREAALLAGLVKNPVGYGPTTFPDRARARRDVVLNRMGQLGVISSDRADHLRELGLGLKVSPSRNGCLGTKAAFFCDYVRRYLLQDPSLGQSVEERRQLLNNGGLSIRTTVDLRFQKAADTAAHARVDSTDNAIGALAMVQPGTGEVFAIAQSRPMGRDVGKGQTFLNYVVDSKYGDSNGFQAGSTFKVFVLATALENGLDPFRQVNAPQTISIPQNDFPTCGGAYPVTAPWTPSNSTGAGSFNMYTGTQQSVNTFFAQLEVRTGLCEPYALARSMGIDLSSPKTERVPSFVLGVADVSPLEMAGAYATFAARGLHCDNRPVIRIMNSDGKLFKRYPKQCQQVMSTNTADTVNDILQGVMRPGGFGAGLALDKPSAGKTGTINGNMAVWFCGYTPAMATASMVAGANQQGHWVTLNGQTIGGSYVSTAHGSTTAGPMWADAMQPVQDLLPYLGFTAPLRVTPPPPDIAIVPNVLGMSIDDATTILRNAGFQVAVGPTIVADLTPGLVAQTSPDRGTSAAAGSVVTLRPAATPKAGTPKKPGTTGNNGHGHGPGTGGGNTDKP